VDQKIWFKGNAHVLTNCDDCVRIMLDHLINRPWTLRWSGKKFILRRRPLAAIFTKS